MLYLVFFHVLDALPPINSQMASQVIFGGSNWKQTEGARAHKLENAGNVFLLVALEIRGFSSAMAIEGNSRK